MIVVLDATMLILLFNERAPAPMDKRTGERVDKSQERIGYLLNQISKSKGSRVIIPAPALGEFLVKIEPNATSEYLGKIGRIRGCFVRPFAERAVIEFAEMQRAIMGDSRRRARRDGEIRAKAKFDQQIVAIAKTEGATTIYSDDEGLASYAKRFGLDTIRLADMPLPPTEAQAKLDLRPPDTREEGTDD